MSNSENSRGSRAKIDCEFRLRAAMAERMRPKSQPKEKRGKRKRNHRDGFVAHRTTYRSRKRSCPLAQAYAQPTTGFRQNLSDHEREWPGAETLTAGRRGSPVAAGMRSRKN